jgi:hypothetical protein
LSIGEHALAGRALVYRQNGAAVVAVDHRNVEPIAHLSRIKSLCRRIICAGVRVVFVCLATRLKRPSKT